MTIAENQFPLGYFYIVSKMNDLVVDLREPETAAVIHYISSHTYFALNSLFYVGLH